MLPLSTLFRSTEISSYIRMVHVAQGIEQIVPHVHSCFQMVLGALKMYGEGWVQLQNVTDSTVEDLVQLFLSKKEPFYPREDLFHAIANIVTLLVSVKVDFYDTYK